MRNLVSYKLPKVIKNIDLPLFLLRARFIEYDPELVSALIVPIESISLNKTRTIMFYTHVTSKDVLIECIVIEDKNIISRKTISTHETELNASDALHEIQNGYMQKNIDTLMIEHNPNFLNILN